MSLFLTVTLVSMILFAMSDYLKSVFLAFRMPGPKAYPIVGNTNFAIEGDGKFRSNITEIGHKS